MNHNGDAAVNDMAIEEPETKSTMKHGSKATYGRA